AGGEHDRECEESDPVAAHVTSVAAPCRNRRTMDPPARERHSSADQGRGSGDERGGMAPARPPPPTGDRGSKRARRRRPRREPPYLERCIFTRHERDETPSPDALRSASARLAAPTPPSPCQYLRECRTTRVRSRRSSR